MLPKGIMRLSLGNTSRPNFRGIHPRSWRFRLLPSNYDKHLKRTLYLPWRCRGRGRFCNLQKKPAFYAYCLPDLTP
jgi:hypothetical protein